MSDCRLFAVLCQRTLMGVPLLLWLFLGAIPAGAHEVRPALFEILWSPESECRIRWKQPTIGERGIRLVPHLTSGWLAQNPEQEIWAAGYRILQWSRSDCDRGQITGQTFWVEGLNTSITDVLVRLDFGAEGVEQRVMRPGDSPLGLSFSESSMLSTQGYFGYGVQHILEGIDHLAFVLGIVLLVGFNRLLIQAITGFTVGHSLTLALTSMDWWQPWPELIEALVALSIVIVAVEVLNKHRGKVGWSGRWPALVALGFGLLHGAAFAGALTELGTTKDSMLPALLLFNLGVEAGQLLFIVALLLIARVMAPTLQNLPELGKIAAPYVIGGLASYWLIDRSLALLAGVGSPVL